MDNNVKCAKCVSKINNIENYQNDRKKELKELCIPSKSGTYFLEENFGSSGKRKGRASESDERGN